jgi:putative FmdB family regulatory protein
MPIYEYRCSACGFQKEYLQKMSDAPLTDCPECGKATLGKMVTAAGFHLKGSGWYVTDFRQGSKPAADGAAKAGAKVDAKSDGKADGKVAPAAGDSKPAADSSAKKSESSSTAGASTSSGTAASSTPASSTPASSS